MAADKVAADKHRRGFSTLSFFLPVALRLSLRRRPILGSGALRCGNLDFFTPAPHRAKCESQAPPRSLPWAPDFDSSAPEKDPTVNGINDLRAEF